MTFVTFASSCPSEVAMATAHTWGAPPAKGISFSAAGVREKERGNALFSKNNFELALASYRAGLDAVHKDVSPAGAAVRLALYLNCAAALLKLERPHEASQAATDALVLDARNPKALLRRAKALLCLGDLPAARKDLNAAAELQDGDLSADVSTMHQHIVRAEQLSLDAAVAQLECGKVDEAVKMLQQAIDEAEEIGALNVAAHGYSYKGIAHQQQGDISTAITCHKRHHGLAKGLASTAEQLRALSNLSSAHQLSGDHLQAIECHKEQAALVSEATHPADLCALYGNMGRAYFSAGQLQTALEYQEKCVQLATDLKADDTRAKALGNLGQTLVALARDSDALAAHRKSLLLAQNADDHAGCARQLEAIALVLQKQGLHTKALKTFDRLLGILSSPSFPGPPPPPAHIARVRSWRAESLHALGQTARAIPVLEDYASILREAGDRDEEARTLQRLGQMYAASKGAGSSDQAVDCHTRALHLRRQLSAVPSSNRSAALPCEPQAEPKEKVPMGPPPLPQRTAQPAAEVQEHKGAEVKAAAGESTVQDHAQQHSGTQEELAASLSLAAALSLAGRHREALAHYTAALRTARQTRNVLQQGVLMVSIGTVLLQDGREKLAESALRQGLHFLEDCASDLLSEVGKGQDAEDCKRKRDQLLVSMSRALRGLQMLHVNHHHSFHHSRLSLDAQAPCMPPACTGANAQATESETEASACKAGGDGRPSQGATAESAAAAAKDALVCALELQALEQLVALGEEGVFGWDVLEDDLDLGSLAWADVHEFVGRTATGLVVLSLLDAEGTVAAWIVPPNGRGDGQDVKMVLMEKKEVLVRIAEDWSHVPGLISAATVRSTRARCGQDAQDSDCTEGASSAVENGALDGDKKAGTSGSVAGRQGKDMESLLRVLYEVCWEAVANHVVAWDSVRVVPHGELCLLPWGALMDARGETLSQRHTISVEPCLKGLIHLQRNVDSRPAQEGKNAGAALKSMSPAQGPENGATAVVVARPYSAQHVRRSRQERAEALGDYHEEEQWLASHEPLEKQLQESLWTRGVDAVQDALDNPPPGGWLPQGEGQSAMGSDVDGIEGKRASIVGPVDGHDGISKTHGGDAGREGLGVASALKAIGFKVQTLAEEFASPSAVIGHCQDAAWIHWSVPLVGGDPCLGDWTGVGEEKDVGGGVYCWGPSPPPSGREGEAAPCDEMEIVLADGVMPDGERDWGFLTARRLASQWRGAFAGATLVVAGRPLDGRQKACKTGHEEVEGGQGLRFINRFKKRAPGRAPLGAPGRGVFTTRMVQVWLAMVGALRVGCGTKLLLFPLRRYPPADVETLMLAVYTHINAGASLPDALALAARAPTANISAAANFVCIGAVLPAPCAEACSTRDQRQTEGPYQWGPIASV